MNGEYIITDIISITAFDKEGNKIKTIPAKAITLSNSSEEFKMNYQKENYDKEQLNFILEKESKKVCE